MPETISLVPKEKHQSSLFVSFLKCARFQGRFFSDVFRTWFSFEFGFESYPCSMAFEIVINEQIMS